jgi:WD40 repeat protein
MVDPIRINSLASEAFDRVVEAITSGTYAPGKVFEGRHDRPIYSVDWSSDNKYLATCAGDDTLLVQASDEGSDCKVLFKQSNAHAEDVNCIRFNPASPNMLASAGDDCLIKVWRIPS